MESSSSSGKTEYFTPYASPPYFGQHASPPRESRLSADQILDVTDKTHFEQLLDPIASMDIKSRTEKYAKFTSNFSTLDCLKDRDVEVLTTQIFNERVIKICGRIGSESRYGEAYEAILVSCDLKFAIKVAPMPPIKYFPMEDSNAWREKEIIKLLTQLVLDGVCPSLPIFYGSVECSNILYQGKRLLESEKSKAKKITNEENPKLMAMVIFNELANTDLNRWFPTKTYLQWKNLLFQVVWGLYCSQKFFGLRHTDLHPGNVLIHHLSTYVGWWEYTIDLPNKGKTTFKLPNSGILAVLWDFGESFCKQSIIDTYKKGIEARTPEENIDTVNDILDLIGKLLPHIEDMKVHSWFRQIFNSCKTGKVDLTHVLENNFSEFSSEDLIIGERIQKYDVTSYKLPFEFHSTTYVKLFK